MAGVEYGMRTSFGLAAQRETDFADSLAGKVTATSLFTGDWGRLAAKSVRHDTRQARRV